MDSLRTLRRLLYRQRRRQAWARTVRLSAFLFAIHLLLLAGLGWLSTRQPLSEAWLQALAASFLLYLVIPLLHVLSWRGRDNAVETVARSLDHANPAAPDPFRTVLSLGNHDEGTRRELERAFAARLPTLVLPRPRLLPRAQRWALGVALLAYGAAAFATGRAGDFLHRTLAPLDALAALPVVRFNVEPPELDVGMGDTVRVRGRVANRLPGQEVYAHVRGGSGERRYPLILDGEGFEFAHGPVDGDFTLQFAAANGSSPAYRFRALALPFLESLVAVVEPPGYTRLRPDTLPSGVLNFPVLPGSRVRWLARADRRLKSLVWESRDLPADTGGAAEGETKPAVDTLGAGRDFTVARSVRHPMEYAYSLEDLKGVRSGRSLPGRVDLLPDHPPEIELLDPAGDRTLDRDLRLPLSFRVKDDFGVTSLRLVWRLLSDGAVKAEGSRDSRDWLRQAASGLVETVWSMDGLELRPENVLEIHLVAVDNDTVNGPKSARSAVRSLRLPSVQEVMEASRKREESAMANLKSAIERERRIERKLEREAQPNRDEALPALSAYEINRIMVDGPRDHARRTESVARQAADLMSRSARESSGGDKGKSGDRRSQEAAARMEAGLRDLQARLDRAEKDIPTGNQGTLPLEERMKNLDRLMESQKELGRHLEKLKEQAAKEPTQAGLAKAQLDYAAQELKRNLEAQSELKKQFQDEAYQAKAREQLMEQSAQEQMRMAEDMKKAVEEIQKTLEEGRKNGLLDQELAEKMKKVQDLIREVLPDSLQRMMERKMAGEEVDPRELRDQLQKVLGEQGELGESLNRALAMLEQLRDRKRLQELRHALDDLAARERDLSERLAKEQGGKQDQAAAEGEQKSIRDQARKALDDFKEQAAGRKALEDVKRGLDDVSARKDMQDVLDALSSPSKGSRNRAASSAAKAAEKLAGMASRVGESMAGMDNAVDIGEAHEILKESLALSRHQLLIRAGAARRGAEGWMDDEPALYGQLAQISGWIHQRVKDFAGSIPFIGAALVGEARSFHMAAREAARSYSHEAAEKSLHHNQNLSRELLKLIKMAQQGGGGGQGGGGSAQGGQSKPGGQGGEGGGDISSQLKGMSGKQMAVNSATQQLLRAMMEGRNPSPGGMGQPGGQDGQGMQGGGQPGGQDGPGREGGPGGRGGDGQGGRGEGNSSMQGLGNRQGEIGEKLESLAEALQGEGGGDRKVRKLAEEARELEEAMRQGRLPAEEIRRRQERFQSRMLEAANALEERGMSEERKAEASQGAPRETAEAARAAEARLLKLLREARREARDLPLSEAQRRHLDEYYESLLTR